MRKILFSFMVLAIFACKHEVSIYSDYPISKPEIRDITLTDNFWLPKIKTTQETTIQFALDKCYDEGRMENFLIAGGEKEGEVRGGMPFDDTDLYKIIEGASYSLISNPDENLEAYLDSLIAIIAIGQEDDGYLTTWLTIDPSNPPAEWVRPTNQRWFNVGGHELYNSGHLFEAASAYYHATGKKNMLNIALKNADLLVETFGPDKIQIPPGHQIVETGLIKLYKITNEVKYLELARFFLDQRGDAVSDELDGEYSQNHLPVTEQSEAVGHAVRAVYMYAGMTDIAAIYQDSSYFKAVNLIWNNIVDKKMYLTGGIGSRHWGEAFGENYELPNQTAYNETCAAIGNVDWNHRLFLLTGNSKYYDIIERTLYNGLISGLSLDGKKFFYPNPLESDSKFEFNHGSLTREDWFDCSCCPTNLIRFIPSIPKLIYATKKDTLFVNLFVSNKANISVNGINTEIIQETEYPWKGEIDITVNPDKKRYSTIKIRIPGWAQNKPFPGDLYTYVANNHADIEVLINGVNEHFDLLQGYIEISKIWEKGDKIELNIPMSVRRVITNEEVKENHHKVAFEVGPVVYCAEEVDNDMDLSEIKVPLGIEFKIEGRDDLLGGINILSGHILNEDKNSSELFLIPYFAWSNRGIGQMKVWFPMIDEKDGLNE